MVIHQLRWTVLDRRWTRAGPGRRGDPGRDGGCWRICPAALGRWVLVDMVRSPLSVEGERQATGRSPDEPGVKSKKGQVASDLGCEHGGVGSGRSATAETSTADLEVASPRLGDACDEHHQQAGAHAGRGPIGDTENEK